MIFDYIGDDYGKCLYIFIDLKKYGLDDDNFNVWIQNNDQKEICAIISEYYGGIQIYSKEYNLIADEIVDFIKYKDSNVVFGIKETLNKIKDLMPEYSIELGTVSELSDIKVSPSDSVYSATIDEIAEIVEIVAQDENIGKPYGYESLYSQYCERKLSNFGRNFILRDQNGEIICHAGTYAEIPELAVIGGVITSTDYCGKGFAKTTLASLCNQLKQEKKRVFSFFYIPSAEKMHYSVGFKKIGDWMKLYK